MPLPQCAGGSPAAAVSLPAGRQAKPMTWVFIPPLASGGDDSLPTAGRLPPLPIKIPSIFWVFLYRANRS